MTVPVTTATEEFNEDGTPKEPEAKEPVAKEPSEDFTELKTRLDAAQEELKEFRGSAALMDKLKSVLTGEGAPANARDTYVRKEILRLMPELEGYDQLKRILPAVLTAMDATIEERQGEKAESARTLVRDLMSNVGLDKGDDEAAEYLEEALTKAISKDKVLLGLWTRGNTKAAVEKAFEKVQAKLFAPTRIKAKQGAVNTILSSPKATPKGAGSAGGITPPEKAKLDLTDTSRDGTRKVHDAAFDYLQELISKE